MTSGHINGQCLGENVQLIFVNVLMSEKSVCKVVIQSFEFGQRI